MPVKLTTDKVLTFQGILPFSSSPHVASSKLHAVLMFYVCFVSVAVLLSCGIAELQEE